MMKVWFHYGYYYYTNSCYYLCNAINGFLLSTTSEKKILAFILCCIWLKTYILFSQKMEQVSEDLICISAPQISL